MPPFPADAMRLGFPVKVMGRPRPQDQRHPPLAAGPALSASPSATSATSSPTSGKHDIRMYRMATDLAPYHTHPDMPQFHTMVEETREDLAHIGRARPGAGTAPQLSPLPVHCPEQRQRGPHAASPSPTWSPRPPCSITWSCRPEAIMVVHVGGAYGDRPAGCANWVTHLAAPQRAALQRRLWCSRTTTSASPQPTSSTIHEPHPASSASSTTSTTGASTPKATPHGRHRSRAFSRPGPPASAPRCTSAAHAPRCARSKRKNAQDRPA